MRQIILLTLLLPTVTTQAAAPVDIAAAYVREAQGITPGFQPAAPRGEKLFRENFRHNDKMPGCTSCHTDNPKQAGEHVVTGKRIQPLAPVANAERFTDAGKVEKWFTRNCKEVIGRVCTPAEKADFITFMREVRP